MTFTHMTQFLIIKIYIKVINPRPFSLISKDLNVYIFILEYFLTKIMVFFFKINHTNSYFHSC